MLNFTAEFSPSSPQAEQGDREWGLWSVHHTLSLPLLPLHSLPLLQRGVPPMGDSPPQTGPTWVLPTGCHSSQTAPMSVLSMGCSLSGTGCSSVESSIGCRWISTPPWTSKGCRGTACLIMVFITGSREISALVPGAAHLLPLLLQWPWCPQSYFSHIFSLLPLATIALLQVGFFFTLLKYVITEALPPSLMGLALASGGSVLDPADTGSIGHRGCFY